MAALLKVMRQGTINGCLTKKVEAEGRLSLRKPCARCRCGMSKWLPEKGWLIQFNKTAGRAGRDPDSEIRIKLEELVS
jgi:hypothetical protein